MKFIHTASITTLLLTCSAASAAIDNEFAQALQYGPFKDVQAAIDRKVNLSERDFFENTPLHLAAESQSGEKVCALLAAGADINASNQSGETPLHRVINNGDRWNKSIEALIEAKGLDVEAADKKGRTLLYLASEAANLEWAHRLLERGAKDSIHAAAMRGDLAAITRMAEQGADINAADSTGATPLILAASRGRIELVRELVRRKALLDAADSDGRTPLMAATHRGQFETLETLMDLGADLNATDRGGVTLIEYGSYYVRDKNGHGREKIHELANKMIAHPRSKPPLRASALLWQADAARSMAIGEPKRNEQHLLDQAEKLYNQAIMEAPKSRAGITATWQLGEVLKQRSKYAALAEVLLPLLVEDVKGPEGFEGAPILWQPNPDFRHPACVEIAEAYIKLRRYPDALKYARLARDKFTHRTFCGTGLEDYMKSVNDRVKRLERIVGTAPDRRRR